MVWVLADFSNCVVVVVIPEIVAFLHLFLTTLQVSNFHSYIEEKGQEYEVIPATLANMDEVPMSFDVPHNRTIDLEGAKEINITTTGSEKLNFTVVLACMANGIKVKPMVIFKKILFQRIPPVLLLSVPMKKVG